jgi:hypothetical protein
MIRTNSNVNARVAQDFDGGAGDETCAEEESFPVHKSARGYTYLWVGQFLLGASHGQDICEDILGHYGGNWICLSL